MGIFFAMRRDIAITNSVGFSYFQEILITLFEVGACFVRQIAGRDRSLLLLDLIEFSARS